MGTERGLSINPMYNLLAAPSNKQSFSQLLPLATSSNLYLLPWKQCNSGNWPQICLGCVLSVTRHLSICLQYALVTGVSLVICNGCHVLIYLSLFQSYAGLCLCQCVSIIITTIFQSFPFIFQNFKHVRHVCEHILVIFGSLLLVPLVVFNFALLKLFRVYVDGIGIWIWLFVTFCVFSHLTVLEFLLPYVFTIT